MSVESPMALPTHMHVFVLRKMDIKRCLRMIEGDYAILGLGMHMTNLPIHIHSSWGRVLYRSRCCQQFVWKPVVTLAHRTLETIRGTRK